MTSMTLEASSSSFVTAGGFDAASLFSLRRKGFGSARWLCRVLEAGNPKRGSQLKAVVLRPGAGSWKHVLCFWRYLEKTLEQVLQVPDAGFLGWEYSKSPFVVVIIIHHVFEHASMIEQYGHTLISVCSR